jgi:hypothetical protein
MSLVHQGINQVTGQIGEALSELRRESHTHQLCRDTNQLILDFRKEFQQTKTSAPPKVETDLSKIHAAHAPNHDISEIHEIVRRSSQMLSSLSKDFADTRTDIHGVLGEISGAQIVPYKELQTEVGLLRQDLSAPWVPILHEEASLLRRGLAGIQEELKAELHVIQHDFKEVSAVLKRTNYEETHKELVSQTRNCTDVIAEMRSAVCGIGGIPHINGDLMSEMNQVRQEFARAVAEIKSASYMAQSIPQLKAEISLLRQDLVQATKTKMGKAQAEDETLHLLRAELMQLHQDRTKNHEELRNTIYESLSKAFHGGDISEIVTEIRQSKAILAQEEVVLQKAAGQINVITSFAQDVLSEIRNTKMQTVNVQHLAERTSLLTDVIREELGHRPPCKEDKVIPCSPLVMMASPGPSPTAKVGRAPLVSPGGSVRKMTPGEHLEVLECKKAQSHKSVELSGVVLNYGHSSST